MTPASTVAGALPPADVPTPALAAGGLAAAGPAPKLATPRAAGGRSAAPAAPAYVPSKRPAGPSIDAQLQAAVKAQEVEGEQPRKSFLENIGKQVSGFFEPVAGVFSQEGEEAEVVVNVEDEGSRKSLIETLGKQVSGFFAPVVGVFSQESKEAEVTVTEGSQDRAANAGAPARGNDQ